MPLQADWEARWQTQNTPWDIGGTTPALVRWVRHHDPTGKHVLVPGAGAGHDAHFLAKQGARVVAVDYAARALQAAQTRYPRSRVDWQQQDVTRMKFPQSFDWVWEYTCFCALEPDLRQAYLDRVHALLKPGGLFIGLTFSRVPKPDQGPPFATAPDRFRTFLTQGFVLEEFEDPCPWSIKPRRGNEYWFRAKKLSR